MPREPEQEGADSSSGFCYRAPFEVVSLLHVGDVMESLLWRRPRDVSREYRINGMWPGRVGEISPDTCNQIKQNYSIGLKTQPLPHRLTRFAQAQLGLLLWPRIVY